MVEAPHRHHQHGVQFNVRIDITVPGGEVVVKREPHTDIYVAIRDAFIAARRQLQSHAKRQRGDVKSHAPQPYGRVSQLFLMDGYGFLTADDGREIYFHKNSVLNGGFEKLEVGSEVRFAEEQGDQGLQASTVVPV